MNNIDEMPAKCKACPYWEACEYPDICQDTEPKPAENGNLNAEIAENPRNRPTDGVLISRREALDALMRERMHLLDNDQPGAEHILTHHGFNVIADLPAAPAKRGKWNKVHWKAFRCSKCNRVSEYFTNYCPNCGARMEM